MKADGRNRERAWSGFKDWWAGKDAGPLAAISRIVGLLVVFALVVYFIMEMRECDI